MAGKKHNAKLDVTTLFGIILGFGAIVLGLVLEKGNIRDLAQYTAAIIVLGGTAGAVLVTNPRVAVRSALSHLKLVFREPSHDLAGTVDEFVTFAKKARRSGILSLETDAYSIQDPFFRKALDLAVDGTDLAELACTMELDIEVAEHRADEAACVFESGGGYAPTIGIIGAVLGLIQVMKDLGNIEQVGHGIAVAFVATVYGVGAANLFLLPAAGKIRSRGKADRRFKELVLLGVTCIMEGCNPRLLRNRLSSYVERPVDSMPFEVESRAA